MQWKSTLVVWLSVCESALLVEIQVRNTEVTSLWFSLLTYRAHVACLSQIYKYQHKLQPPTP